MGKFIPAANQRKNWERGFPWRSTSGMCSMPYGSILVRLSR